MHLIDRHQRGATGNSPVAATAIQPRRAGASRLATLGRAAACAAIGVAVLASGGCESPAPPPGPEPVVSTMTIDRAMQARDWAPTHAYFVNTTVQTGSNGVSYEPKRGQPAYVYYVIDTTTFLTNVLLLPISAWEVPPDKDVPNRGATFAPSYTDARPATPF